MNANYQKIVIVTRRTELDELVRRFNTRPQAAFYLQQAGHSMDHIDAAHQRQCAVLKTLREAIPGGVKHQVIERERVPQFLFGDDDLVVTVGQDGLVSNTAKYLDGQPIFAINPDPSRYDGALLPFNADNFVEPLRNALRERQPSRRVTLAEVVSSNNQSLLAFNDFFIGARSHLSTRYDIAIGERSEFQSSSGVIVSTGAGSTGWLQSVYAGAAGVVEALGGSVTLPADGGRLPWESDQLVYSVREPFPSAATRCTLVHGRFDNRTPLTLTSRMGSNGVVFSDGVESDYLEFNSGTTLTVQLAAKTARLLITAEMAGPHLRRRLSALLARAKESQLAPSNA